MEWYAPLLTTHRCKIVEDCHWQLKSRTILGISCGTHINLPIHYDRVDKKFLMTTATLRKPNAASADLFYGTLHRFSFKMVTGSGGGGYLFLASQKFRLRF